MKNICFLFQLFMFPLYVNAQVPVENGVSRHLAETRSRQVANVVYELLFDIPYNKNEEVRGEALISFDWKGQPEDNLQIDFQGKVREPLVVNKESVDVFSQNEHLVIPGRLLRQNQQNTVWVKFVSGDKALNRNDEYLYTLFVPDHARSVFPCFDQPDIKACFKLKLLIPDKWKAISNAPLSCTLDSIESAGGVSRPILHFHPTQPLPTYLFSFTAGQFQTATVRRDNYELTALYRETDSQKVRQLDTVFDQIALSLRWMENYTGIRQPFSKYGFVVLPGYQFGGMEHPGCIQFRDKTIFLDENPTPDELLNRLHLLAHETAHLWFGDLVTMRWFDDVWTKEVFANFMADKIASEQFPDINHDINFLKTHYVPALATDRTEGTHPIQQPLDNLNNAGMLYGNIIYHKAPIMMRNLEARMGERALMDGLRVYLEEYAYANATWDDLIAILDSLCPNAQIDDFDKQWVKHRGLTEVRINSESLSDPMVYGRFVLDEPTRKKLLAEWFSLPETSRFAAMMYVYEDYLQHHIDNNTAFSALFKGLSRQDNPLILSTCCNYLLDIISNSSGRQRADFENLLYQHAQTFHDKGIKRRLLQGLMSRAQSPQMVEIIYETWRNASDSLFTQRDYMAMAYHLALLKPEIWQEIIDTQRKRLDNADVVREFDFVSRACNPAPEVQLELFESLLIPANRSVEPHASAMLELLNDPLREPLSNRYILPALEALEDVQRTGDIFFPLDWCQSLLYGHRSREADMLVRAFLESHPNYPNNLKGKLLQAAFRLMNANSDTDEP